MSQKFTYHDWVLEQKLSPEQNIALSILLRLMAGKLEGEILPEIEKKIRSKHPGLAHILDIPEISQEMVFTTLEANLSLPRVQISRMFEGIQNQGNFARLAEFMR
ncbi:hypothetical protein EDM59_12805 [Brevibacillus nitrificans]|uniref:Uncharacterized protein n=1 Tax=Brevibacillus nitrificans TaxID=651560 RepID=A0A3M8DBB6_9BACL|nr:hypothetical protein [Brevibacillus nitrificans]RNB85278.1 hypothetical protein EDM59_12805 [Brevibacillus nitrificans]